MTPVRPRPIKTKQLRPSLALTAGGADFLSATRMRLLEALDATGSIAAAARAAWNRL